MMPLFSVLALSIAAVLALVSTAHAYIDPASGSYVFQVLIAGAVGGAFAIKQYWGRVRSFFARIFVRSRTN